MPASLASIRRSGPARRASLLRNEGKLVTMKQSSNETMLMLNYINQFLEYCELDKNLSPSTLKMYRYYLETFNQWLVKNAGDLTPDKLSPEIIRSYRLYLSRYVNPIKGPLKRTTQLYFLIAIRTLLHFFALRGIKSMPADQIELGKGRDRTIKFLDEGQLERLLSSPEIATEEGLRDKAILETLFSTGLRVAELVKLNRDQINIDRREFGVIGKGGKARVVYLSEIAASWLSRYLKARDDPFRPLFIHYSGKIDNQNHGEKMRLTARSVERIVEKYGLKIRLPFRIGPHSLRHSFATDLLMHGADIRSVQEMLGHKNIGTTQIYTHVTNKQLRDVHEAFHGRK